MSQAPEEFYWISSRLVTQIVETARARGQRRSTTVEPRVEVLGVSIGAKLSRGSEQNSIYSYALEAASILRAKTGTLGAPDEYIRFRLAMRVGTIDVPVSNEQGGGWRMQRVAVIYTDQHVSGIGRVFLAFFGSPSNILSDMDNTPYTPGRVPSAAPGLMRIMNETRAQSQDALAATETQKILDKEYLKSAQDQIYWANALLHEISDPLPPQSFEVLARADSLMTDVDLDNTTDNPSRVGNRVELAAVGAVVWAGFPPARNIALSNSEIENAELRGLLQQESVEVAKKLWRGAELQGLPAQKQTSRGNGMSRRTRPNSDEVVDDAVLALHLPDALVHKISEERTWHTFVDWFFETTNAAGLKLVPLYKRRSLVDPRRYGYTDSLTRDGSMGQPIPNAYQSSIRAVRYFVSTDGRVFRVTKPEPWEHAGGRELRSYGRPESRLTIATTMWRIAIDSILSPQ